MALGCYGSPQRRGAGTAVHTAQPSSWNTKPILALVSRIVIGLFKFLLRNVRTLRPPQWGRFFLCTCKASDPEPISAGIYECSNGPRQRACACNGREVTIHQPELLKQITLGPGDNPALLPNACGAEARSRNFASGTPSPVTRISGKHK
jgi:hypothetical protein